MGRSSVTAAYRAERIEALLFTPKNVPPPWQTVIFFPGSNALHVRSSKDPTGIYLHACSFLIKSGRALLYPIYKSTYERGDGLDSDNQDTSRNYRDHVLMWARTFRARSITQQRAAISTSAASPTTASAGA